MRKVVFAISLVLFVFLAACNQTPRNELSAQGGDYGQLRFNVVSDYRDGAEETNFNGQFDEGEFLVPDLQIMLTPINEKGEVIGEPFSFLTNQAKDPREGAILKVPVGMYQPELVLPTELQGGKDYAWKPFGPPLPELPPIIVKNEHLFDGIYSVGCEYGGRQFIQINGFEEYQLSPCFSSPAEVQDSITVSPSSVEFPCNSQQLQTTVNVHHAKGITYNPVTLSVDPTSLPAGMTVSFSTNPTSTQSTLTISRNGVAAGSYQIMIQDSRGLTTTLTVSVPSIVFIPDSNLKSALRAALNIPQNHEICRENMLLLTRLDANSKGISNLEGLQYATNLTVLKLFGNSVSNLTPLSGLSKLTGLELSRNSISDISPLSGLTCLDWLFISRNSVGDLKPLSSLRQLTMLALWNNVIIDISPLSGLTKLRIVALQNNSISNITPLVNNPGLGSGDEINLQNNPLNPSSPVNIQTLQSRGATVSY
jgi:hypothetical protein